MLDKEIKIVIGHEACLGAECLYCVDSCPREVRPPVKVKTSLN